jgi:hypothetical protein
MRAFFVCMRLPVPLVPSTVLYARATLQARLWLDRIDRLAAAFLSEALTTEERTALGIRLYDVSPLFRGSALWPWESSWFGRRLPPPPARILVGACGAGREVVGLAAQGYIVDAFEPAPGMFGMAQARCDARSRAYCFRYEDLSAAVLDGVANAASPVAGETYDAVLLGCGSLSHVLEVQERQRLMRALGRLCPRGPLLASFLSVRAGEGQLPLGRAERLGAACGRGLARLRSRALPRSSGVAFAMHAGFYVRFAKPEIEALADSIGRKVLWEDDETDQPHATFV